jgi:hypothetical protein
MVEIQTYKRGFKRKTIVQTIENKMNAWIKTLPESMREKVNNDYIVTGGAIASMLLGDLFFDSRNSQGCCSTLS